MTATRARTAAALIAAVAGLAFAAAALLLASALRDPAGAGPAGQPRMSLSGTSHIIVTPDTVRYQLRFERRGSSPGVAAERVHRQVRSLAAALEEDGLGSGDVAVVDAGTSQLRRGRWISTSTVSVTVHDIDRSAAVLRTIRSARVAWMQGPTFDVGDENDVRERALSAAVASARRKADEAARRGGMRVAGIIELVEQGVEIRRPGQPDPMPMPLPMPATTGAGVEAGSTGAPAAGDVVAAKPRAATAATSGGEFTAVATVSVAFRLEPR